jgi:hypothetical protein
MVKEQETFSLEIKVIGQMTRFMVPTNHKEPSGKIYLVSKHMQHQFAPKEAAVDIVPQEKVRILGRVSTYLYKLQKIIIGT